MRHPKISVQEAMQALARESGLSPELLDRVVHAISGTEPPPPATATVPPPEKATVPPPATTTKPPPDPGPDPVDDLSPTMRDALTRLATTSVEVAPTQESRAKLRWYRTMGALVKRGYAMQDYDPNGEHAFLITRLGTATAVRLGLFGERPTPKHSTVAPKPSVAPKAPKRTVSGTMRKVGT